MRTVTIDILKDGAVRLLRDMELLELIRVRSGKAVAMPTIDLVKKYKGAMTKQLPDDVDEQLNELRNEWE